MAYTVDSERCEGCGACVDACPNEAIRIVRLVAVVKAADCTECGGCEGACPVAAVRPE
jgi:NAD-dependent dihydropyrimidine dehydrogenase PreA subunit